MTSGNGSRTVAGAILALAFPWSFLPGTAVAAELDAGVQQQIRAATFEVVQLKPPDGEVTYERPLPMELMPYQQRTDLYRSIGTAFAVGPNRYVTAGHVVALGVGSQFGPPALRDGTGKVYPIDQVLADLPDGFQSDWHRLTAREFPYNATISNENGETHISTTASFAPADGAKILYGLKVVAEGAQSQEPMKSKLDMLQHSFKQLE